MRPEPVRIVNNPRSHRVVMCSHAEALRDCTDRLGRDLRLFVSPATQATEQPAKERDQWDF